MDKQMTIYLVDQFNDEGETKAFKDKGDAMKEAIVAYVRDYIAYERREFEKDCSYSGIEDTFKERFVKILTEIANDLMKLVLEDSIDDFLSISTVPLIEER